MFAACGVPVDKFRSICSAVDKLDKVYDFNRHSQLVESMSSQYHLHESFYVSMSPQT